MSHPTSMWNQQKTLPSSGCRLYCSIGLLAIMLVNFANSGSWSKRMPHSSWRKGMNTSVPVSPTSVLAVDVRFSDDALIVRLSDGREVSVPLEWFPRLRDSTPEQRQQWRLIARGIGIHWEAVDEDIAVTTLLRVG